MYGDSEIVGIENRGSTISPSPACVLLLDASNSGQRGIVVDQ